MTTGSAAPIAPTDTVNDVIARHPATLAVFRAYGIDACCGGPLPLDEVCRRHDLSLEGVLGLLAEAAE